MANRSVVLHQLGHHRAALQDIKRSLEAGYPQSSLYKLYSRQASCFSSLGQQEVAARCLERAREAAGLLAGPERERALRYLGERAGTVADKEVSQARSLSANISSSPLLGETCQVPAS